MKQHQSLQLVYGISEFKWRDYLFNDFAKLQLIIIELYLNRPLLSLCNLLY